MTIDAHVHFWKYNKQRDNWITNDMKILREHYLPEQLDLSLRRNGIDGVVAVQASQEEVETRFLCELAATHPVIKGVVGWIDLQSPQIAERLQHFAQYPAIKGYRHIVQAEPDNFLLRPDFQRGIGALQPFNYTYDLLIYPRQLPNAIQLVGQFPDQPFVIDHCAKPEIRNHKLAEWEPLIREIALQPNVHCKLSGLLTEAAWKQWSAGDLYPYLDVVFDAFGTNRLLFASDWPVMLLSGIYVQWKSLIEKYMEQLTEEEKENVFGTNAVNFYHL
ncbi:MAG: amidohydrolase family protein [Candidatus Pseudobacter hemicellulosilyticus]|uniref:Amidohydrolase family protein n=1 Tax=Candidatus Pseudobacter hemicellulosilyticus TaxID=3121375 RepID=A0AAJ5WT73_9BACT|nr:MAG: amidohydrolase family protein [Pseudobacter sp.]